MTVSFAPLESIEITIVDRKSGRDRDRVIPKQEPSSKQRRGILRCQDSLTAVLARRSISKSVTIDESRNSVHACFEPGVDYDSSLVHASSQEMQDYKQASIKIFRYTYKNNKSYRHELVRMFRTKNFVYNQENLELIADSPCRGLERKMDNIFLSHRQWVMDGVLSRHGKAQAGFAFRASHPCRDFAVLLAAADRMAADEVYLEVQENDQTDSSTNPWSDVSDGSFSSFDSLSSGM